MASFPTLKTGAVAQYPFDRAVGFQTQAVRFLDGSSQRFRIRAALRKWTLDLDLLDEDELASVVSFFEAQGTAPFAFTDPISGDTAPACVLSANSLTVVMTAEHRAQATVLIEEIA